ncbi:GntR family transcriptional regulator [Bacillus sp. JJ1503]|uniref:GntR family transcriptional regulator n=1 Tax=unclassified Bacillus (in: firmicutes) TaxID=185979 RepID=UPI002FFE3A1C
MSISKIKTVNRKPLNMVVYDNIKSAIVNGEIEPGTRLTETAVSEQMNVSSTPVREAFRRLASEGLVKIIPWRGVVVQEFSSQKLVEVYQCREALEVKAIQLAVEQIDETGIEKLKILLEKSKVTNDYTKYTEINTSIHETLFEYANNNTLTNLIGQINDVILHNRNVSSYSESRKDEIYEEHKRIIQALENRNKDEAAIAMKEHIENGFKYIKTRLEEKK